MHACAGPTLAGPTPAVLTLRSQVRVRDPCSGARHGVFLGVQRANGAVRPTRAEGYAHHSRARRHQEVRETGAVLVGAGRGVI